MISSVDAVCTPQHKFSHLITTTTLTTMTVTLSQEEMDAIIYDARDGDLEFLQEVFSSIVPGLVLPSIQDDITLSTPVHMAAANGHTAVVEYLLSLLPKEEAVKLANRVNQSGNTALHWAAFNGHLEVVKLLVEKYNADVFVKNESGRDALFEAESNGQQEVENWFLLKFAIENDVKVEQDGEDTKITFTPGSESHQLDREAAEAAAELKAGKKAADAVADATAQLSL